MVRTDIKFIINNEVVASTHNIITNRGKLAMTSGGFPSYISIGTGSQEELPSVELLSKPKRTVSGGWRNLQHSIKDIPNNTITNTAMLRVALPVESSNTIYSELGISDDKGKLYSYALLRDSLGEVSTVTVLKGERLEIEYTVEYSLPYKSEYDEVEVYLLNMPQIYNVPKNLNGSHNIYTYVGENNPLEVGSLPSGAVAIGSAKFSKVGERLSILVPPFVNRPQERINGFQCIGNTSYPNTYTYCIAFKEIKTLKLSEMYTANVFLPLLLKE